MANNREHNKRIPHILLEYSRREQAYKKELLCDFSTGRLYVVSAESKDKIFDITQNILDIIASGIDISNQLVTIDGIGDVNISKYLNDLEQNRLHAENDDEPAVPVVDICYDMKSLVPVDSILQVANFDSAYDGTVPVKSGSTLRWCDPSNIVTVDKQTPINSTVTLTNKYTESEIDTGVLVKINVDASSPAYIEKIFKVTNGLNQSTIKFDSSLNIHCQYDDDLTMHSESTSIFTLKTFNKGDDWYLSVTKHSNNLITFTNVSYEYLTNNYYDKAKVEDLISWKNSQNQTVNS